MDPLTIMALAQVGLGIGQMVKGAIGSLGKAPTMEIPKSATQALNIAKTQAGQSMMPGQKIMEDKLASQAAAASQRIMEASGGSGAALGGLAQVQRGLNDQLGNLAMNQASYIDQQKQGLRGELGNMANWEQQQFQMNQYQPYLHQMDASRRLTESGMQNLWGAAGNYVQGQETKKMWDGYLGSIEKQLAQGERQFTDYMSYLRGGGVQPQVVPPPTQTQPTEPVLPGASGLNLPTNNMWNSTPWFANFDPNK